MYTWITVLLVVTFLQSLCVFFIMSECPYLPFKYQDTWSKFRSMMGFFLIPMCQGLADLGMLYIASYMIRVHLPVETTGGQTVSTIFLMSYISSCLALIFKGADTSYDMIVALLWPLYKLIIPIYMTLRDLKSSISDTKN